MKKMNINLNKNGISINGVLIQKIEPKTLTNILGQPRKVAFETKYQGKSFPRNICIWDNLGILLENPTNTDQQPYLEIFYHHDEALIQNAKFNYFDLYPTGVFDGMILLDNQPIIKSLTQQEIANCYFNIEKIWGDFKINLELKEHLIKKIKPLIYQENKTDDILAILSNEKYPFVSFSIAHHLPKNKQIGQTSKEKYQLKSPSDDDLIFDNFNFKLAIIQELMYEQEVLLPKFDVNEFCRNYQARQIDPNDYSDEMIPEVKAWFENLPIPKVLAQKVEKIDLDGGNQLFLNLIPAWHGEDEIFDIDEVSEREFSPFFNLKIIHSTAPMLSKKAEQFFKEKGVVVGATRA